MSLELRGMEGKQVVQHKEEQDRGMRGSSFFTQCRVLTRKNAFLAMRNWKGTAGQLLAPVAIVVLLIIFQQVANSVLSNHQEFPPTSDVPELPRCLVGNPGRCQTVLYAPDVPAVNQLMEEMAKRNGLNKNDFQPLPNAAPRNTTCMNIYNNVTCGSGLEPTWCPLGCFPQAFLADNETFSNYIVTHLNETQNAILFYRYYYEGIDGNDLNALDSHILYFNFSVTQFPFFYGAHMTELKRAIDESALALRANEEGADITDVEFDVSFKSFPLPYPRVHNYNVVASGGGVWFYLPPMITFFIVLTELVMEKESRLRLGMRMMGLRTPAFWASWLLYGAFFVFASTMLLDFSARIADFQIFTNSNFFAPVFLFLLFGTSMVAMAFLLSTLINHASTAQTLGYTIILVGFVFQAILSTGYGVLVDILWSEEVGDWVKFIRVILCFYPPFNMSKIYYDISKASSPTVDFFNGVVYQGAGFNWTSIYEEPDPIKFGGTEFHPATTATSFNWMLFDAVLFFLLAFYLDTVLEGDQGAASHPLWCLMPSSYSCCRSKSRRRRSSLLHRYEAHERKRQSAEHEGKLLEEEEGKAGPGDVDRGVQHAALAAADLSQDHTVAVRILGMVKMYRKSTFARIFATVFKVLSYVLCCRWCCAACTRKHQPVSDEDEHAGPSRVAPDGSVIAVDGLSFTIHKGEVFCLLGHNGAGKTTTINILTGLFSATEGLAEVFGMDVNTDLDEVQKHMGVCPQHDILWDELTAAEHLALFAEIKGVKGSVAAEVQLLLEEVGLVTVAQRRVGTFSGGMKRRLSVAISAIGNPRLIVLDEPTTGMDPVNRRSAWKLVQRLKRGRAIVLTTHSMEEADTLGDRIGIMAHGKLMALGNSLALKNTYGAGYRLNIMSTPKKAPILLTQLQRVLPSLIVTARDAGNLSLTVPPSDIELLPNVIEQLEENTESDQADDRDNDDKLVKEWGVSHTTLEEVFLEVSRRANFDLAMAKDEEEVPEGGSSGHAGEIKGSLQYPSGSLTDGAITTGDSKERESSRERRGSVHDFHDTLAARSGKRPTTHGWRALCRKSCTLLTRQKGLCLCQLMTPLIVIILLVIFKSIIKTEVGGGETHHIPAFIVPSNPYYLESLFENNQGAADFAAGMKQAHGYSDDVAGGDDATYGPSMPQDFFTNLMLPFVLPMASIMTNTSHMNYDRAFRQGLFHPDPALWSQHYHTAPTAPAGDSESQVGAFWDDWDCLVYFYFTADNDEVAKAVGSLEKDAYGGSGLLGELDNGRPYCYYHTEKYTSPVPYFVRVPDAKSSDAHLYEVLNNLNAVPFHDLLECYYGNCPAGELPDGVLNFHDVVAPHQLGKKGKAKLDYTVQVNDVGIVEYHRPNGLTRFPAKGLPNWVQHRSLTIMPAYVAVMDLVTRGFEGIAIGRDRPDDTIQWIGTMPEAPYEDPTFIAELLGSFLYPLALTLQLPLYVFVMVLEKETKLREMQASMGMRWSNYMAVTYLLNFAMYLAVVAIFWIAGVVLEFSVFLYTSPALLAFIFVGWGLALVSMSFLLASLVSSRRVATVLGYVIALFGNLIALVLCDGIYGNLPPFSLASVLPKPFYAFPLFGLVRSIYLMNYACIARKQCYATMASIESSEIPTAIWTLYLCAVVYLIVGLYLDQVLPRRYGVPKHPLFCFGKRFLRRFGFEKHHEEGEEPTGCCGRRKATAGGNKEQRLLDQRSASPTTSMYPYMATDNAGPEEEDSDVRRERERVLAMATDVENGRGEQSRYPVLIKHLRKSFGIRGEAPKVAVGDLCLSISKGECFGLLGVNGAGKSTTINMLTGVYPPSGGEAWVGGHSIRREIDNVHLVMGICPQHDVLWEDLTVKEHLLFYSRLKGIPASEEKRHVQSAMEEVGLASVANRLSKELSGGMKRRLSVAMSICGNSEVVFMDEPSTGLDPASRRRLWRIIERAKRGRAVVLTTHSMDEAELLCSRISIFTLGRMRCLGTQQHLKSRYGGGYRLYMNFRPEWKSRVLGFVRTRFPNATPDALFRGFASFRLATEAKPGQPQPPKISQVFTIMDKESAPEGITDWGVGQVTLEDVFQRIVRTYRASVERQVITGPDGVDIVYDSEEEETHHTE